MDHPNSALVPFYLAIDVSWSMSLAGKIEAVGNMVSAIVHALVRDPMSHAAVRFGLVEFSDDACIRLPLDEIAAGNATAPELKACAGTSFRSVFNLLKDTIPADLARLATSSVTVGRPTIFLLTDGEPTDDEKGWRSAFASLTALPARPSIVPCGVDQATVRVMGALVHPQSRRRGTLYMMDQTYSPARAITAFAEVVISSMLTSSRRSQGLTASPSGRRVPAGLTRHRITVPPQPARRGEGGHNVADLPYRQVGQNASAAFLSSQDHGTIDQCRNESSSDVRPSSPNCGAFSTGRPTAIPRQ